MASAGDRGQRGITGLESSIGPIAFGVVPPVFAFTVLSAGVFACETNKQTIFAGLKETLSRSRQNGSAFAFAANVGATDSVYKLLFVASNDMSGERTGLTLRDAADRIKRNPDFVPVNPSVTAISFADDNQRLLDVPRSIVFIGNHDSDTLRGDGKKAEVTIRLLDRDNNDAETVNDSPAFAVCMDTSRANGTNVSGVGGISASGNFIGKSTRFVLELAPQIGVALTVQRVTPLGIRPVMNLN